VCEKITKDRSFGKNWLKTADTHLKFQAAENQALQNEVFAVVLYSTDIWCLL